MGRDAGAEPILRAENLTKDYETSGGILDRLLGRSQRVRALDGVDLELYEGETLGIVGESGCGKTTLGRTLLRLIEPTEGTVSYRRPAEPDDDSSSRTSVELTACSSRRLRELRTDLQYVFQDPSASLNPRLTVGELVGEPLTIHGLADGEDRIERIHDLLETVGLNPGHSHRYPHELSGGQRQRVGIARALAVEPDVIVCDEPVSALDVSVQAQILNLLADVQEEFGLSYVFIAHDLRVVERVADRIAVVYLGEVVEKGSTDDVFSPPYHPYTEALLSAIPEPDPRWEGDRIVLPGAVPSPIDPPSGCRFHARCPRIVQPPEYDLSKDVWRSLVDLTRRVADAETVDSVVVRDHESGPAETAGNDEPSVSARTGADVGERLRDAFGLPNPVSDPAAERTLSRVIEDLRAENVEDAERRLRDAFPSPCRSNEPEAVPIDGEETHRISCLHFDDEFDDRSEFDSDGTGAEGADETDDATL